MPVDRLLHPRLLDSRKISELSHLEYRVWSTYILVADDFGVMPMEATKVQVSRALANERAKTVLAALAQLAAVRVVAQFEHQRQPFIWSPEWQYHQKIRYPRREETHYPPPPEQALEVLTEERTEPTRMLFATFHTQVSDAFRQRFGDPDELLKIAIRKSRKRGGPGGSHSGNVPGMEGAHSGNVPGTFPERSGNARVPAREGARNGVRLTANGQWPMAEFGEGLETPLPPLDVWLSELQKAYPPQAVTFSHLTMTAFVDVIAREARPPTEVFADILEHLENQKRGYQWRVKRMIPRLDKWLRDGLWQQRHDETPPLALISERTLHTELAGEAFVKGGAHGR